MKLVIWCFVSGEGQSVGVKREERKTKVELIMVLRVATQCNVVSGSVKLETGYSTYQSTLFHILEDQISIMSPLKPQTLQE